jgi:hypothetical protein
MIGQFLLRPRPGSVLNVPRVRRQASLISRARAGADQYIAVAAPNSG